jgi:hypothetical protein
VRRRDRADVPVRVLSANDGLRRLDRTSRLPIGQQRRSPTDGGDRNDSSIALWRAHVEKALSAVHVLKAGTCAATGRAILCVARLVLVLLVSTFCRWRGARPAHRSRSIGRARWRRQLPRRCLGDATPTRPAAVDPARFAPG